MRLTTIERDSVALARQQGGAALDSGSDAEELLVRDLAWDGRREDIHLDLSLGDDEVERWQAGSAPLEAYLDAACGAWARQGLAAAGLI